LSNGFPHATQFPPSIRIWTSPHLRLGHCTSTGAPQWAQVFAVGVSFPQAVQTETSCNPQPLQTFQPFSTGLRHLGQRMQKGSSWAQYGQDWASPGMSLLQ